MYEQALSAHAARQEAAREAAENGDVGDVDIDPEEIANDPAQAQRIAKQQAKRAQTATTTGPQSAPTAGSTGAGATASGKRYKTGDRETDEAMNHPALSKYPNVFKVVPEDELPGDDFGEYDDEDDDPPGGPPTTGPDGDEPPGGETQNLPTDYNIEV